jgi:hypothetical protein
LAAVNGSVSVGITVLVVAEQLASLDYNAYCKKLAFLKLSSPWCVHQMKSRLKTGLMESLPVETVARDGKYGTFQMNFQLIFH